MTKTKYDFIRELLKDKKFNQNQRERILELASRELSTEGNLEERVLKIEEMLAGGDDPPENEKKSPPHKPKETYDLLSYFSSTERGMKNLTHAFNYGFIAYEELIKQCRNEFEEGKKKYPNVPVSLLKRIEEFAFSETPDWYIMRGANKTAYSTGWSEKEFIKWYKENQIHPALDKEKEKEMINPFRETIQVRTDLGNLYRLINDLAVMVFQNSIKLTIKEAINSAQFYTDVDRLGLAFYHIFTAIKQVSLKNFCDEVEIDFRVQDNFKVVEIIHKDSVPTKSVNDSDFLGGDLATVKKNLWGLCNYDIIAKFPEGKYRKVILSDKIGEFEKNENTGKWLGKNYQLSNTTITGFTHNLKFY